MFGKSFRSYKTDPGQSKRVENTFKWPLAGVLDRRDQVSGRYLTEALEPDQLLFGQLIDIGHVLDQFFLEKAQCLLFSQPVDVHRPLADEVFDVLKRLAWTAR